MPGGGRSMWTGRRSPAPRAQRMSVESLDSSLPRMPDHAWFFSLRLVFCSARHHLIFIRMLRIALFSFTRQLVRKIIN